MYHRFFLNSCKPNSLQISATDFASKRSCLLQKTRSGKFFTSSKNASFFSCIFAAGALSMFEESNTKMSAFFSFVKYFPVRESKFESISILVTLKLSCAT
eukprot:TRINITY_DN1779_c0_g1_i3.p2 TRINITY_DN1779_c0_g1~~TRINITY_DN1779_c0_g1_i3.p2  ORF type:complete len:100 (-),score=10.18 TRINITY_DN1779_c0_g1_i3:125-424(-)